MGKPVITIEDADYNKFLEKWDKATQEGYKTVYYNSDRKYAWAILEKPLKFDDIQKLKMKWISWLI